MNENLKATSKQNKRKKEILNELSKLGNQNLTVLQNEVAGLNGELDELKEQWNEFKKPKN